MKKNCSLFELFELLIVSMFFFGCVSGCVSLPGKAYWQASPHFDTASTAINGAQPTTGRYSLRDMREIIYLNDRVNNTKFEEKFAQAANPTAATISAGGVPGAVINNSDKHITFYLAGPFSEQGAAVVLKNFNTFQKYEIYNAEIGMPLKSFTLAPNTNIKTEMSPGIYICYYVKGAIQISPPRIVTVKTQRVNFYFTEWVYWGIDYTPNY